MGFVFTIAVVTIVANLMWAHHLTRMQGEIAENIEEIEERLSVIEKLADK